MTRLLILTVLVASVVLVVSCTGSGVQPAATAQPTTAPAQPAATTPPTTAPTQPVATTPPTMAPTNAATQTPSTEKLNLDEYFPLGKGRDLLLQSCTGCHSFVPIITGQRTKARWESIRVGHRDAMLALGDSDYNVIYDYLGENFNNTKPEPKLPEWFLKSQTGTGE